VINVGGEEHHGLARRLVKALHGAEQRARRVGSFHRLAGLLDCLLHQTADGCRAAGIVVPGQSKIDERLDLQFLEEAVEAIQRIAAVAKPRREQDGALAPGDDLAELLKEALLDLAIGERN